MHRIVSLVVLLALSAALTKAAEWPNFRGPNRDGIAPETKINTDWTAKPPVQMWKVDLTDDGFAGPAVAGGIVYILDHQGKEDIVRAIDLNTGTEKWRFTYEDPSVNNYGFARATPTVDNGLLYTMSNAGTVHCLNAKTGEKVWSRNLLVDFKGRKPGWEMAFSPLIDGDKLILLPGAQNSAMVALNKKTGEIIWQGGGSDVAGYTTPVIATINEVKQYVVVMSNSVIGVEANTGKLLWSYPWSTTANCASAVVIGNSVFVTSSYGKGCMLLDINGDKATPRWESKVIASHFSTPILYKNYLYTTTDPHGSLVCVNPQDGTELWRAPGFEKGGSVGFGHYIITLSGNTGDCVLAEMSPDKYQELGRFKPLGGQSWTAPVVADGRLLVRNTKILACYDLR